MDLPAEIILLIASMDPEAGRRISLTCKRFNQEVRRFLYSKIERSPGSIKWYTKNIFGYHGRCVVYSRTQITERHYVNGILEGKYRSLYMGCMVVSWFVNGEELEGFTIPYLNVHIQFDPRNSSLDVLAMLDKYEFRKSSNASWLRKF